MIAISLLLFLVIGLSAIFVDRARAEAARLRLLVDLSERLQLSPSITDATRLLPSFAARLFPGLEGAVYVGRSATGALRLAATWCGSREADTLPATDCNALLLRTTQRATAGGESLCDHAESTPDAEMICVPMLDAGEPFGMLLLRAPSGTPLPRGIERLAEPFAHQVALALSNLRLQETLRDTAQRDSLTGLFNRRCIAESLTLELLSGGDPDVRVGVILIDVDHFKRFNDTWGHGGGDVLLQQLARVMLDVFNGEDDVVCRYGGEEFVVVLPGINAEALRARAERLLVRVRDLRVECDGHLVGGITVSAGIAISHHHATSLERLIESADRAMYSAKAAGRDRVSVPPPHAVERVAAA